VISVKEFYIPCGPLNDSRLIVGEQCIIEASRLGSVPLAQGAEQADMLYVRHLPLKMN
jgi:hypothetical protein